MISCLSRISRLLLPEVLPSWIQIPFQKPPPVRVAGQAPWGFPCGLLFHCQACAGGRCLNPLLLRFFLKNGDHFKSLYLICYNITSVLCFGFFGHEACGILALRLGIQPVPPVLEDEVLTTGPPGSPEPSLFHLLVCCLSYQI